MYCRDMDVPAAVFSRFILKDLSMCSYLTTILLLHQLPPLTCTSMLCMQFHIPDYR